MDAPSQSFEQYAAGRLRQETERITGMWVDRLSSQLDLAAHSVLPHAGLLDDVPLVLERAAAFLLVPDPEKLSAEELVVAEMRNIAMLRRSQGWALEEVVREFDELAQVLDGVALRWIEEYPGTPEVMSVARTFGRLNRVPLLMGWIMVGALEAERNELQHQLATAEEEERMRLSRELHDQLGQLITALLLGLKSLPPGQDGAARTEAIGRLVVLADRLARETQQLALDLRPPALDNLGLRPALENLVQEWSERTGVEYDFQSSIVEGTRFPPEIETALYRVAQEGLNNVLKHAGASHVSVVLERRQRILQLILEDDGSGFDVERTLSSDEKSRRLGIRGMRERLARLRGTLTVEASPGSGTSLFVRIPVPAEEGPRS